MPARTPTRLGNKPAQIPTAIARMHGALRARQATAAKPLHARACGAAGMHLPSAEAKRALQAPSACVREYA